jgi:hypothetical protein
MRRKLDRAERFAITKINGLVGVLEAERLNVNVSVVQNGFARAQK